MSEQRKPNEGLFGLGSALAQPPQTDMASLSPDVAALFSDLGISVSSDREALNVLMAREREMRRLWALRQELARQAAAERPKRGRPKGSVGSSAKEYDRMVRTLDAFFYSSKHDGQLTKGEADIIGAKFILENQLVPINSVDAATKGIKAARKRKKERAVYSIYDALFSQTLDEKK